MDGIFSLATYEAMKRNLTDVYRNPSRNPMLPGTLAFGGIPIQTSNAFPMTVTCSKCNGTGEGVESTYCPACKGQGKNRYEGMMRNGDKTILLTVPQPKAFAPRFPLGMLPVPKLCRGLP